MRAADHVDTNAGAGAGGAGGGADDVDADDEEPPRVDLSPVSAPAPHPAPAPATPAREPAREQVSHASPPKTSKTPKPTIVDEDMRSSVDQATRHKTGSRATHATKNTKTTTKTQNSTHTDARSVMSRASQQMKPRVLPLSVSPPPATRSSESKQDKTEKTEKTENIETATDANTTAGALASLANLAKPKSPPRRVLLTHEPDKQEKKSSKSKVQNYRPESSVVSDASSRRGSSAASTAW